MASFSDEAFDTAAFSVTAFDFGSPIPPPAPAAAAAVAPSGGFPAVDRGRTRREITRDRERFGIPDEERIRAEKIARQVAAAQAARLEMDAQKQYDELSRELAIERIETRTEYLEAMNAERSRLIDAEIAVRLRFLREEEEVILLLLMAASAA